MSPVAMPPPRTAVLEDAPAAPRRRRSRAKPRAPRARLVVTSEMRALAAFLCEWALLDRTARPQASVIDWADRLAAELGLPGTGRPRTNGELFYAVKELMQRAEADPDRPMVALPPAA